MSGAVNGSFYEMCHAARVFGTIAASQPRKKQLAGLFRLTLNAWSGENSRRKVQNVVANSTAIAGRRIDCAKNHWIMKATSAVI